MGIKYDDYKELIKRLNIEIVNPQTNFWMIRTKKGFFYEEFINEGFVALGWNIITQNEILNIVSTNDKGEIKAEREKLKKEIEKKYPRNKQASQIINKCIRFVDEMKTGDIIMIPSAGNDEISFCTAGEYYEDSDCTYENEIEVIDRIDSKKDYGIGIKCPYKKRRKITVLKRIDGERLNINLYKVLASYHGISRIDKHSEFILSSIYNIYYRNNIISMVFNVEQKGPIDTLELSGFMYNASKLMKTMDDNIGISTKVNLNSAGDLILAIQQFTNTTVGLLGSYHVLIGILGVWIGVAGGKVGPVEFPSIVKIIMEIREHKSKLKVGEMNMELQQIQIEKERINLQRYYDEITSSATNLEINRDAVQNVIDIRDYHHENND